MNIILTQKDADFILKFIREDLKRVSESSSDLKDHFSDLQSHFSGELKSNKTAIELMGVAKELTDAMNNVAVELKNELERCVLLLTVGSEDLK